MKALHYVVLAVKWVWGMLALLVSVVHPWIEAFDVIRFFRSKTKKPLAQRVEPQVSWPGLALAVGTIVLLRGLSAYTRR